MITISLNTFIKVCLLDTGGRISEIQKRLSGPGGYDFYKPLQNAVRAHCSGQRVKVDNILEAPTNATERKHNRAAFESFESKFGSIKKIEHLNSARKLNFPDAGLSISVDPLFEFSKSGARQAHCLWPTQSPFLTQRYGAVACHIMRRTYASTSLGNASFFFSDLVTNRTYSEKQITNNTNLILMADVTSIGALIREL